jgi:hypothetical protein
MGASDCSPLSRPAFATIFTGRQRSGLSIAKRVIDVEDVKVEVTGTFGNPGEPARDISYRVQVRADARQTEIDDLIRTTDAVTEIQNTVRGGCAVELIMGG